MFGFKKKNAEPVKDDAATAADNEVHEISSIFADDDDDAAEVGIGDDEDDHDDGDEDRRPPVWRNPILLASLGLLLLIGCTWVAFDRDAYEASLSPPSATAALTPPPRAEPAQQAAAAPATNPTPPPTPGAPAPGAVAALTPAPDPGLVGPGPVGPLPIIGQDGREPWKVYARPFALPPERPKIAIVIGGLGLSRAATLAAIQQLPADVTLAFAAYAPNLEAQIAEARAAGHEVILQLPMEPNGYPANDPGPHTLLVNATTQDNLDRLHWLLSRFQGYVGVTNYMGAKISTSADALRPILSDLKSRGLLFLDARETPDGVAGAVAAELAMPRAVNNRFLDADANRTAIDARLLELERLAATGGSAIGIGYAYPVTIERTAAWIRTLRDKNVVLAPISAVARTTAN